MNFRPAFLFLLAYMFLEYVRPQTIYPWLAFFPWARATLFAALAFSLLEGRFRFSSGKSMWTLLIVFTLIIVASSLQAPYPEASWNESFTWTNWLIVMFVIGAGVRSVREILALILTFCLWNLKMSQHATISWAQAGFAFRDWGVAGAPGWFQNSGEFGIEMCVFVPISAGLVAGLWPSLSKNTRIVMVGVTLTAIIGVVGSSSRGALLGLGAVALWAILASPKRLTLGMYCTIAAVIAWFLIPEENLLRWETAGTDETSTNRLTYWKHGLEIAKRHPVLGIGYQNWIPYYRTYYNPKGELPHNYFIEAVSQLGYIGFTVFVAILVSYFLLNAQTRRRASKVLTIEGRFIWAVSYGLDGAMVGFLVSGFFVSVLWYPFIWVNIAFALSLAAAAHQLGRTQIQAVTSRAPRARTLVGVVP